MTIEPFSDADITAMHETIAGAQLQATRVPAVGGNVWIVTTPGTGDTVTAAAGSETAAGTVTASVYLVKPSALEVALSNGRLETSHWELTAADSEVAESADPDDHGLWEGRVIQSEEQLALRFRITSLDVHPGYVQGRLEQL